MGLKFSRKKGSAEEVLFDIEPASSAPKAAGTADVGTSTKYAREDHEHPAQTSVSGNAGTATKLATSRNISLTGDVTGSASFNGTANASITAKLKNASVQLSASGTRSAAISANTNYTVPSYIVGSGRLQVFLDGVLCAGGSNADTCAYKEVGSGLITCQKDKKFLLSA